MVSDRLGNTFIDRQAIFNQKLGMPIYRLTGLSRLLDTSAWVEGVVVVILQLCYKTFLIVEILRLLLI